MTATKKEPPLIAFYGDDFTGSTDAMEVLEMAGLSATLFLEPPDEARLARVPASQGLGVAGISRSLKTADMEAELRPKFEALRETGARLMHYKVCSTLDSSPEIGSIGRAIDIGFEVFPAEWSPVVIGAPRLNRFVAFGNLFARVGRTPFRLDRHPTMSRHPVTPMTESDIRRHLSLQTEKVMCLVDTLQLQEMMVTGERVLPPEAHSHPLVVFDTIREDELAVVGEIIWNHAGKAVRFSASSSGLEYALAAYWRQSGQYRRLEPFPTAGKAGKIVVMSGSAAPATAAQIADARARGWGILALPSPRLVDPASREQARAEARDQALRLLEKHDGVVLFATEGPEDAVIEATRRAARSAGIESPGQVLGRVQGELLREILEASGVRRVCVAGGDTSGYCAQALGIFALRVITPIDPGSPLCRAYADGPFDGLVISLKGGQVGRPDYFYCIQNGDTSCRN